MTPEIISVIALFACAFNRPTWKNIQTLMLGAILSRGARRVTNVLRVMNLSHESNFEKYHRVLNRSAWDGLILSKILFGLLIKLLPESWPILVAVDETLECLHFTCLWYHAGVAPVTLRIVLVKTPGGKNEAEVFFSTDISLEPVKIINYFVLRWNLEVTFFETRAHLGVETQRQWSDKAIQRTTPLLMGLYSLITLIAIEMNKIKSLMVAETTSWYDKKGELTFVDIIAAVRRSIWSTRFSKSANHGDLAKSIDQDVEFILDQLALAA